MGSHARRCQPGSRAALRRSRGLTLVELMVAVAMLACLLALGAPQFTQWGRSTRVTTQASELHNALAYARSEAQRRGVRVSVCASTTPQATVPSCATTAAWASGWLVFVDNAHLPGNAAGVIDGADTVLRVGDPATNSTVAATGNLAAWVSYTPQGLVRTAAGPVNGGFTLCQAPHGRRITVSPVGLLTSASETCT